MRVSGSKAALQIRNTSLGRRPRRRYVWENLADDQLLSLRFCDLKLAIDGTDLEQAIERLYGELATRGIRFRPHCWLAQEWFSPDGIPGIAVPFYLAHQRLARIERRFMREVEGGNRNWLMRILRHEAGHAIDSAYRVRRRRGWREVFGPASLPYPDTYRPRPGSRRVVRAGPSHRGFCRDVCRVAEAAIRLAPRIRGMACLCQARVHRRARRRD